MGSIATLQQRQRGQHKHPLSTGAHALDLLEAVGFLVIAGFRYAKTHFALNPHTNNYKD